MHLFLRFLLDFKVNRNPCAVKRIDSFKVALVYSLRSRFSGKIYIYGATLTHLRLRPRRSIDLHRERTGKLKSDLSYSLPTRVRVSPYGDAGNPPLNRRVASFFQCRSASYPRPLLRERPLERCRSLAPTNDSALLVQQVDVATGQLLTPIMHNCSRGRGVKE